VCRWVIGCVYLFTQPSTQDEELHAVLDGRLVGVDSREIDRKADDEDLMSASPMITRVQITEALRVPLWRQLLLQVRRCLRQ
jgi:hypothetical protein